MSLLETIDNTDPDVQNLLAEDNDSMRSSIMLVNDFNPEVMGAQNDDDASEDLYVTVADPQEVGTGVSAYATYAVSGRSSLEGFPAEFNLRRRFSDFQWLYEEVLRSHPGYVVPPLPEASVFNKFVNKFEEKVLEYRTRELQRFLRRMAAHPALRNSSQLGAFLQSDEEFAQHKVANTATVANKAGSKFSALYGMVKKSVVASVPALTGGPPAEEDDVVAQKTAYLETLLQGLTAGDKAFHAMVESHRALKGHLAMAVEAGSVMARAESLDAAGSAQQEAWRKTAHALKAEHNALNDLVNQVQLEFEDRLHDYKRYVEQVQLVLRYRYEQLTNKVSAMRHLDAKKNASKQVMSDIEAAEKMVQETSATFDRVNALCKEEIARFETTKGREVIAAIARLGRVQCEFHLKAADAYKVLFDM